MYARAVLQARDDRPTEDHVVQMSGVAWEDYDRPHLAIEVVWTSGRLDKLEVYRKLGVQEVWYWRKGRIQASALRGSVYEAIPDSEVLPGLDLEQLTSFLDRPSAYDAIQDFRAALRARP